MHVAPLCFLQDNGVSFSQGDQIAVVGSTVTYEGHDAWRSDLRISPTGRDTSVRAIRPSPHRRDQRQNDQHR